MFLSMQDQSSIDDHANGNLIELVAVRDWCDCIVPACAGECWLGLGGLDKSKVCDARYTVVRCFFSVPWLP